MLQLNHYLTQESGSPRPAQRESCLPKGQAGIQVFFRVLVGGVHGTSGWALWFGRSLVYLGNDIITIFSYTSPLEPPPLLLQKPKELKYHPSLMMNFTHLSKCSSLMDLLQMFLKMISLGEIGLSTVVSSLRI